MLKRLVSGAALAALTGALVFGGSTAAQATTTPDASCVNSDPLGLINVVTCSINVDVDVLPDAVITFGDILGNNKVLNGTELDLLEVTIENVLKDVDVEDNLVFKGIIVDAVDDLDLIDDIDVSKVIVDLL
ncbi:hypothetical protein [Saccharothrix yanglingensis]|uniref:Secreted protein n=1 Tax=Saccharothrix yanglingensis TaxID=659496 RepID=A0ABU0X4D0_9PSEU|nr:hypothetical protein [Saccharothrix yanglingensis]MDQ2586974.1 hypothetical protein [Saccharothrix yanglingensis]